MRGIDVWWPDNCQFGFMKEGRRKGEKRTDRCLFCDSRAFLSMGRTIRELRMTTWRTTVIMKTDIKGSTVRLRPLPEADHHALLKEQRAFLFPSAAHLNIP